eukprot:5073084-Prymnesium_polylepis.1
MKASRSSGSDGSPPVRSTLPQTTMSSCQSLGFGRIDGDQMQKHGTCGAACARAVREGARGCERV